jgi:hypothetical protein
VVRYGDTPAAIRFSFSSGCALSREDRVIASEPRLAHYVLPLGHLTDGTPLSALTPERLRRACDSHGQLSLSTRCGTQLQGQVLSTRERDGRLELVNLAQCRILHRGELLLSAHAPYPWLPAARVVSAHARPPDGFHPETSLSMTQVPKPRQLDAAQRELLGLYDRALAALQQAFGGDAVPELERVHRALCEHYPDEWLLRWNLLESLLKLGQGASLMTQLTRELTQLELRYAHREPIATGLSYLRSLGLATDDERASE